MNQNTFYEWDIETVDKYDDIIDHAFSDLFPGIPTGEDEFLSLVKSVYKPHSGDLDTRAWAKVVDDKLPAAFDDNTSVPKRFHREVK